MNSVYLVWQDHISRLWHPVAKLTRKDGYFLFSYTRGAAKLDRFKAFVRMEDMSKVYRSDDLFPMFKNRIIPPNRPEFYKTLEWVDMDKNEYDPLSYLAYTGGARNTDNYMIIPIPVEINGVYTFKFLVSGVRYLSSDSMQAIESLQVGEELSYRFEENNQHDKNAILLETREQTKIGYCPRYLAEDFKKLILNDSLESGEFIVEKVNLDAPSQFRILCSFSTKWPENFIPFVSEDYLAYRN